MNNSAKRRTFYYLNQLPPGTTFKGQDLRDEIIRDISGYHYVATILRYMREYRDKFKVEIKCIDKRKSLYKIGD